MLPDKEIKNKYKPIFWKKPEKYYPTKVLEEEGFTRNVCKSCNKPFWSIDPNREICGEPSCAGGFSFIGNTPAKNSLSYIEVWLKFSEMFKKFGYTPIERYPVVARWNPTMEYTNASIAAFQPFVISGEVKPPANPLVIPQFCLRFGDIDNVGVTGSHNTGFVMIGQHMFVKPEQWDQNEVFRHIHTWLKKGLGLPNEELTFHEDAWAGGGNLGCCIEFFSRGCEIGNQVYMLYEQTKNGVEDLKLKVLDMGMGQERNAWFSQGTPTIYDATFPTVCKKLFAITGVEPGHKLMSKFTPLAGKLNIDEVEDINAAWQEVANKLDMDVEELRVKIMPLTAVYSIAEHSRSLLFALADGALPSNTGGGYNLRALFRRSQGFMDRFGWNVYLPEVCEWHAQYLKPIFPELLEKLEAVKKILDVEKAKYDSSKQKSKQLVSKIINEKITEEKLLELYDSQGINPEMLKDEASRLGKQIKVPDDFYTKITARHEQLKPKAATEREIKLDLENLPETESLYFDDYKKVEFKAKAVKIIGNYAVLDKTFFYPVSGGQLHDEGTLNSQKVVDVFKQGPHVVHVLSEKPKFKEGDNVTGKIDLNRRVQLTQHHTATHIVNAAARKVLGDHVNQSGAFKDVDKARLDVTHYQSITQEELEKIEEEANKIVKEDLPVRSMFLSRDEAEKKFGMRIYQGGAVPGKKIRIIEIPEVDVEACGGTHLKHTGEVKTIRILKTAKIQDGVCRIIFAAGKAAETVEEEEGDVVGQAANILGCKPNQVPGRAEELFGLWKDVVKKGKKVGSIDLKSTAVFEGDLLLRTAEVLKAQPEHVLNTINRFLKELKEKAE